MAVAGIAAVQVVAIEFLQLTVCADRKPSNSTSQHSWVVSVLSTIGGILSDLLCDGIYAAS